METEVWDTFKYRVWSNGNDPVLIDRFENRATKAREAGLEHCEICGRGVKANSGFLVHCMDGGGRFLAVDQWDQFESEASDADRAADLGFWVLGPECGKKFPARYRKAQ